MNALVLLTALTLTAAQQAETPAPAPTTETTPTPAPETTPSPTTETAPAPTEAMPAPTPTSPREAFRERALRLESAETFELLGAPTLLAARGKVVRANGTELTDEEVVALAPDEKVREGLSAMLYRGSMRTALLAISVAGAVVPAVVALVCGVLGGALGAVVGALAGSFPALPNEAPQDTAERALLGLWIGGMVGAGL
ncbi:MAG: hypothetical protein AB2A00_37740, partial [Myxococcota bacterium]